MAHSDICTLYIASEKAAHRGIQSSLIHTSSPLHSHCLPQIELLYKNVRRSQCAWSNPEFWPRSAGCPYRVTNHASSMNSVANIAKQAHHENHTWLHTGETWTSQWHSWYVSFCWSQQCRQEKQFGKPLSFLDLHWLDFITEVPYHGQAGPRQQLSPQVACLETRGNARSTGACRHAPEEARAAAPPLHPSFSTYGLGKLCGQD